MTEPFETKLAVVLEADLAVWQMTNATAFLISWFAISDASLVGQPYVDGSGNSYLPKPVMVYAADAAGLRRAYERTLTREMDQFAIFTRDLFTTPYDEANRAAVSAVRSDALDLVGIAVRGPRRTVDKIVDKLRPHEVTTRERPKARACNPRSRQAGRRGSAWLYARLGSDLGFRRAASRSWWDGLAWRLHHDDRFGARAPGHLLGAG